MHPKPGCSVAIPVPINPVAQLFRTFTGSPPIPIEVIRARPKPLSGAFSDKTHVPALLNTPVNYSNEPIARNHVNVSGIG